VRVWVASGTGRQQSLRFLAVFNLDDGPKSVDVPWSKLGVESGRPAVRDLWDGHRVAASDRLQVSLPAHGCVLYAVGPEQ
jgi:alpha-galactosidase